MRICIIQSCYIPWKGFFDLIGRCDEYVVFDSAQYVRRHWHNRNRIKTANGVEWLTIPVIVKGRFDQSIDGVEIEKPWAEKHWRAIELAYKRAAFFDQFAPMVKGWYEAADKLSHLSEVNSAVPQGNRRIARIGDALGKRCDLPFAGRENREALGNCVRGRRRPLSQRPFGTRVF